MSLHVANYLMLNLYMNNRGATKGKGGGGGEWGWDDKSCFVLKPEKTSHFPGIFKFNHFND